MNDKILKLLDAEIAEFEAKLSLLKATRRNYYEKLSAVSRGSRKVAAPILPGTIKEDIVRLLAVSNGLKATEVLEKLSIKRRGLKRESLSPQLSRLKQAGHLSYRDGKWFLNKLQEGVWTKDLK